MKALGHSVGQVLLVQIYLRRTFVSDVTGLPFAFVRASVAAILWVKLPLSVGLELGFVICRLVLDGQLPVSDSSDQV